MWPSVSFLSESQGAMLIIAIGGILVAHAILVIVGGVGPRGLKSTVTKTPVL